MNVDGASSKGQLRRTVLEGDATDVIDVVAVVGVDVAAAVFAPARMTHHFLLAFLGPASNLLVGFRHLSSFYFVLNNLMDLRSGT